MSRKTANPYLGEFELQRVLALIGYLATDPKVEGVKSSDAKMISFPGSNGDPNENDWLQVVKNHPEFFAIYTSISGTGEKTLLFRLWERNRQDGRTALEPDRIRGLYETAMKLHEAAIQFSDLRRNWYAFWISLVTGLAGGALGAALLSLWKGN